MIPYQTLYWVVALVIFIWFNLEHNSFDDGFLPMGRIRTFLHKLVGGSRFIKGKTYHHEHLGKKWDTVFEDKIVSTQTSRFRVSLLLYLLSWVLWFIIF